MTLRLALRALLARPVRSAILAGGFGLGIGVMANLLGIGEVILEQARSPDLVGGGDVIIRGAGDRVENARFLLANVLSGGALAPRVRAASPSTRAQLYLVRDDGSTERVWARGGVPSLEKAVGDRETATMSGWTDSETDRRWTQPDAATLLRSMDRFHPVPRGTPWESSWAEWLYFNGRSDDVRFYLTFLVGSFDGDGLRPAGVRLQLERNGRFLNYGAAARLDEARLLETAPEIDIAGNRVRLDGMRYVVDLTLRAEDGEGRRGGSPALTASLVLEAMPGRSMPPMELHGARGWVSGYVVPVLGGPITGHLTVDGERLSLDGGQGYHDHNWGFWEGVTWQWGQVAIDDLSIVYGRVHPPADVADPQRVPGVLAALGPDGPLGFATHITIDEHDAPAGGRPESLTVRARGQDLALELQVTPRTYERTRMGAELFGEGRDFYQMRGEFRVSGRVRGRDIEFVTDGSAETFR